MTLCLLLCLSEISAAIPFSGGLFGYIRASLGPFLGFFVGVFELLHDVILSGIYLHQFSGIILKAMSLHSFYQPITCCLILFLTFLIIFQGRHFFWYSLSTVLIVSLLIICGFSVISLQNSQFLLVNHNNSSRDHFFRDILEYFMWSHWWFQGMQRITVVSSDVPGNTHEVITKYTLFCIFLYFFVFLSVKLAFSSLQDWQDNFSRSFQGIWNHLPVRHVHDHLDLATLTLCPYTRSIFSSFLTNCYGSHSIYVYFPAPQQSSGPSCTFHEFSRDHLYNFSIHSKHVRIQFMAETQSHPQHHHDMFLDPVYTHFTHFYSFKTARNSYLRLWNLHFIHFFRVFLCFYGIFCISTSFYYVTTSF